MNAFDSLAEQRIREAQEKGEFDELPGAGAPLNLEDDPLVPEELRAAYRLLKNAGYLPPELEAHGEIRQLEQLLRTVEDVGERASLLSRINFLLTRGSAGQRRGNLQVEDAYYEKIAAALERQRYGKDEG
jgi:hypothetical protein